MLGPDLGQQMYDGATQFGAEYAYGNVTSLKTDGNTKIVETDDGTYTAKAVIIATGAEHRKLGIPGEEEFSGVVCPTVPYVMAPFSRTVKWS